MFCFPPHPLTRLRLVDGLHCRIDGGCAVLLVGGQTELRLDDAASLALLAALQQARPPAGPGDALAAAEQRLLALGVLGVDFLSGPGGPVVATLQSSAYVQAPRSGAPPADWRLHPRALLWPDPAAGWRLAQPLSAFGLWLAEAGLLDRIQAGPPGDELAALLRRALWAGGLAEAAQAPDAALGWGREDLWFHTASLRRGDHRPRGRRALRAAWAAAASAATPGAAPSAALRQRLAGVSFEQVLSRRRSVRGALPALAPEDLHQLLAAVQAERGDRPTAPSRAYPMAGGLKALDLYLVSGAPPALRRFDAATGALAPVAAPPGGAQRLLDDAAQGWGEVYGRPQALVVITADLPELSARYEAVAYRLALLEAGCAAQVLMQVATALGIATCLLGSGDSELFALAAGLPEWQRPALAGIAIAGRLPP